MFSLARHSSPGSGVSPVAEALPAPIVSVVTTTAAAPKTAATRRAREVMALIVPGGGTQCRRCANESEYEHSYAMILGGNCTAGGAHVRGIHQLPHGRRSIQRGRNI